MGYSLNNKYSSMAILNNNNNLGNRNIVSNQGENLNINNSKIKILPAKQMINNSTNIILKNSKIKYENIGLTSESSNINIINNIQQNKNTTKINFNIINTNNGINNQISNNMNNISLNIKKKTNTNDDYISYDTESNDSSPRSTPGVAISNSNSNLINNLNSQQRFSSLDDIKSDAVKNQNNLIPNANNISKNLNVNYNFSKIQGNNINFESNSQIPKNLKMNFSSGPEEKGNLINSYSIGLLGQSVGNEQYPNADSINIKNNKKISYIQGPSNNSSINSQILNMNNNSNNSNENIPDILNVSDSLRNKLFKQILDIYKTNPDKLLNDLGPTDFAKVNYIF